MGRLILVIIFIIAIVGFLFVEIEFKYPYVLTGNKPYNGRPLYQTARWFFKNYYYHGKKVWANRKTIVAVDGTMLRSFGIFNNNLLAVRYFKNPLDIYDTDDIIGEFVILIDDITLKVNPFKSNTVSNKNYNRLIRKCIGFYNKDTDNMNDFIDKLTEYMKDLFPYMRQNELYQYTRILKDKFHKVIENSEEDYKFIVVANDKNYILSDNIKFNIDMYPVDSVIGIVEHNYS